MSTDPSPDDPTLLSSGPPSGGGGEPGAPLAGDGRYELLKELAHGGMGVVYAARDPRFGREVAVKTLHARLRDRPDVVTRFVAEARFTGRLQHPGIPPVHELGTLPDGRPYLAMKLVSGRTLARWLAERTDPADDRGRLLAAFGQVCQAVGYAHEQGLIHRDLKPSNVMVGAFGEVQVMDWGIAKDTRSTEEVPVPAGSPADPDRSADPEATLTAPPSRPAADSRTPVETAAGTILGTPQYMAPEQARGEPVGSRADVFGLGAILCEILTGRPPFSGASSLDCVLRAATGDLGAAWERLAGCGADPELVALCRRCLATDPADRPANGGEVAAAVAAYQAGVEGRLRTAEQEAARAAERRRRQRAQAAAALALGLLLLGGGGLGWWVDGEKKAAGLKAAEDKAKTAEAEAKTAAAEARVLNTNLEAERLGREIDQQNAREREQIARSEAEARSLLDGAAAALAASDARRAETLLDSAARAIKSAERAALAPGGGEGPPGGAPDKARLDQYQKALALLRELDRIGDLRWQTQDGKFQKARAAAELRTAFAGHGIVPTSPDVAARLIGKSVIGERLRAELNWWLVAEEDKPARESLLNILEQADPDTRFRNLVRVALVDEDWNELEKQLKSADVGRQPEWFIAAVGTVDVASPAVRAAALKAVLHNSLVNAAPHRSPYEFSVLMSLGRLDRPRSETAGIRARCCQAALALRPRSAAAWHNLGAALRDGNDHAGAVVAFNEALQIDPNYLTACVSKGSALLAQKHYDKAIEAYEKAQAIDPKSALPHDGLILVYVRRVDESKAARGNPPDTTAEEESDLIKAEKHYRAVTIATRTPADGAMGSIPPWALYGDFWLLRGEWDKATDAYRKAANTVSGSADGLCGLGRVQEVQKRWPEAVGAYREAVSKHPLDPRAHSGLARALWQRSASREEARAEWREVIRLDPRSIEAHYALGAELEARKEFEGALEHFESAQKLASGYKQWEEVRKRLEKVQKELEKLKGRDKKEK